MPVLGDPRLLEESSPHGRYAQAQVNILGESMSSVAKATRVHYVDWVRGLAIGLALFSHFMLAVGGWGNLFESTPFLAPLKILTRTATPAFIVLFGASIEFAYIRRWGSDRGEVVRRVLRRALKCYGAAALLALAALLGAAMSLPEVFFGLAFVGDILNGNIYIFYTVALVLAVGLVPLRRTLGIIPTFAITLTWWPIAYLLQPFAPANPQLDALTSRLFGIGDQFGPSVLHALPLMVAGMAIGQYIRNPHQKRTQFDLGIITALALTTAAIMVVIDGPVGVAAGYADNYRAENHPAYFACGFLAVVAYLLVARTLENRTRLFDRSRPGVFGGSPLMAFTVGNIGINVAVAGWLEIESVFIAIAASVGYLAVLYLSLRAWRAFRARTRLEARQASAVREADPVKT
jgi:uncharacterized membrane protein